MEENKRRRVSKKTIVKQEKEENNNVISVSSPYNVSYIPSSNIWGWTTAAEVADDVWKQGNYELLRGKLVFAYRNTDASKPTFQIIVVHNPISSEHPEIPGKTFGVNVITNGYTALIPRVPFEYIETEVVMDLSSNKVNSNIIETYKQIVENIKEDLEKL